MKSPEETLDELRELSAAISKSVELADVFVGPSRVLHPGRRHVPGRPRGRGLPTRERVKRSKKNPVYEAPRDLLVEIVMMASEMSELFSGLDEHLSEGGEPPEDWV
jgi:hypothetical protein